MKKEECTLDEHQALMKEAHYIHTINAFVDLIDVYGYDKVMSDLKEAGDKTW